jgi:PucR C-terminal helix-turn-helix domain/GGDEF-like domain
MASAVSAGPRGFGTYFVLVDPDKAWLSDVSARITDAIHAELPELDAGPEMRVSTLASTESVLSVLAQMLRTGQPPSEVDLPPAAVDYARQFVRHGVPLDVLLRAFHVGQATFFECWSALAREQLSDPAEVSTAVELGAMWTFAYVDALNRGLIVQYGEERERWIRSAAALRADTVRALLGDEPMDGRTAGQRLRYELDRHHLAFVVWCSDTSSAHPDLAALEHTATRLAEALGVTGPLLVRLGPHLVAGWIGASDPIADVGPRPGWPDPESNVDAFAAVGCGGRGAAGFSASHRQALQARRVAMLSGRRPGAVVRYRDVGLTALASMDAELAREYVREELGPLADDTDEMRRLAATLRVYLEEHASPRRTARRLGLHENTIKNRVRTVTELLAARPEERIGELLVALRLAALDL